jgi:hypothetical protein
MKFILFIEGHTEKKALSAFFKKWLDPRLVKPVGIKTVRFEGARELVKDLSKKVTLYLDTSKQHKQTKKKIKGSEKDKNDEVNDIIAVIALLDLYGLELSHPADKKTSRQRYEWAKKHLENQVNHPKFRQFFAVHETEAWLLSDPNLFSDKIKKALPKRIQHPEEINFDMPPAKLLERLYDLKTGRTYKKIMHGSELFRKLDPNLAYIKCPRLKALLDEMLKLAKEAGL